MTAKPTAEYADITVRECPKLCGEARCVISGRPYCAHPHKGGLQGVNAHDAEARTRFNGAKKVLGKKKLDLIDG